jgi:hypothetical protein
MIEGIGILNQAWDTEFKIPESMVGSMVALPLPKKLPFALDFQGCAQIQKILIQEKGVTPCVPVPIAVNGRHYARITAQIYNEPEDYRKLARAVLSLG